jgi:hypothetical protein
MKSLARSYVWWPKLDQDIENLGKRCMGCQQIQNLPAKAPVHHWEYPTHPWHRIHIDYAGPFYGYMYLIMVDAHSKWLEVIPTKSTTTETTIQMLRTIFARNGLPVQLVSDNGPQFTSEEFKTFLSTNGITHFNSAPYHPSTNGIAERFVQTFKQAIRAMKMEEGDVNAKLAKFLLAYRNTPHSTTNESPAQLLFKRDLRTRLDLIKPCVKDKVESKYAIPTGRVRTLEIGDKVLVRNYLQKEIKWYSGTIVQRNGTLTYYVEVEPGKIWKRHIDQIKGTQADQTIPEENRVTDHPTPVESSGNHDFLSIEEPEDQKEQRPERTKRAIKPPDKLNL